MQSEIAMPLSVMLANKFTSPIGGCAVDGSFGLFRQGCLEILHRSTDTTTNI
ncbi:MAG TPA: hypothetical protein VK169_13265 [Saprospiraceae bacterium]|nr:hypothetical protein [Saprospiraceae bacterium]